MRASGIFVLTLMVFPRARLKPKPLNINPRERVAACHPTGWIQTNIFTQWFEKFIKMIKPKPDDPIILIPDGLFSHTRNLEAIARGKKWG
jgi:hypothetical protein